MPYTNPPDIGLNPLIQPIAPISIHLTLKETVKENLSVVGIKKVIFKHFPGFSAVHSI
jgi:hypothetical protein